MTPQIALDLSLDGIAVLSRAEDGTWWREGVVRLDADDMAEGLTRLQARAVARVGEGFTSILIIPDSQLLFTSLERDDRDPKVTIRALLRGRTPYEVEDLAFDYVQKGDRLQVAVVALETLMEAEEFAAGFGFQPVAIIGNPVDATYPGMPHFGQTGIAAGLLGGDRLVLDVEDGFDVIPAPIAPGMPEAVAPETEPTEPDVDGSEVAPETDEANADDPPSVVRDEEAESDEIDIPAASAAPSAPTPVIPAKPVPETFDEAMADAGPPVPVDTPAEPPQVPLTPPDPKPEPTLPAFSTRRRGEPVLGTPTPAAPAGRITPRLTGAPAKAEDSAAPTPKPAASNALGPVDPPVATPTNADEPFPDVTTDTVASGPANDGLPKFGIRRPAVEAPEPEIADPEAVALALPGIAREQATAPKGGGAKLGLYLTLSLLALMAVIALWSLMQDDATVADVVEDPVLAPVSQETAMLIPNADGDTIEVPVARPVEPDVADLLPSSDETTETAAVSELVTPPEAVTLAEEPETPNTLTAGSPDAGGTGETFETAGNFEESPSLPDAPEAQTSQELVIASVDPKRTEADTSPLPTVPPPDALIAPQAPALPTPEEEQIAPSARDTAANAVEPDLAETDAVANDSAPETATEEVAPDTVASAPAPVEETAPEEEAPELVTASAEGTLAPGGYTVFTGRPTVEPVQRASTASAPLVEAEPAAPALSPEEEAARAALRRVRPLERPQDAVAETTAAEEPAAQDTPPIASGFTREELTRTRPRQRPESIIDAAAEEAAEAARTAAEASRAAAAEERDAAVQAAAAAAVASLANQATASVQTGSSGSNLALAVSDRPRTRPRSVEREAARIVTRRREQASAAPTTADEAESSPEPAAERSRQTIRSAGGSVARAATQQNAIRLREINLIGVYGRPNARRALVRLPNGRYVKVEVGDRLDRGRVTAIGDTQLVYQRSGRNVTLRLPNA